MTPATTTIRRPSWSIKTESAPAEVPARVELSEGGRVVATLRARSIHHGLEVAGAWMDRQLRDGHFPEAGCSGRVVAGDLVVEWPGVRARRG